MPSSSSPSTPKAAASTNASSNKSSTAKQAGQGSQGGSGVTPNFAQSYGLKYHDPADYQEAKDIQQAFRDADAESGR